MRTTTLLTFFPLLATATPSTCGSSHLSFTLDPINLSSYYTYTSPSASGPKAGYLSFTLQNDQVDYTSSCSAVQSYPLGTFYGSQIFECITQDGTEWKKSPFSFDSYTSIVQVNSTWTCGGDVAYTTSAHGELKLTCQTSTWKNPDWQRGELFSNTSTVCKTGALYFEVVFISEFIHVAKI